MPSELDSEKYKILQRKSDYSPVILNLEESFDINLNWHQANL